MIQIDVLALEQRLDLFVGACACVDSVLALV